MKCFTCHTEMECYNDVNNISTRIDFVKCPKCGSEANIIYGNNGEYIKKVEWFRQ
jgi:Zn finger protein HypA/HybF involved in hydrogenase expression